MRSAFLRWLLRPGTPTACVALALLLAAPALGTGLAGDDYFHRLVLTGNRSIAAVPDSPMAMFVWASGDPVQTHAMMEVGMTGWWTNPKLVMAYFRPLAVATHWLDYRLWPNTPWLMHLHSLAWFGLALLLLAQLYRRLLAPPLAAWLPVLALLLYAVDDAHAMTLAWIANRNAILALALGIPVLLLHDRHARDGEQRAGVAAPIVLGLALLAGESALAVAGYLFAYALFIDPLPRARALLRLWPFGLVLVVWAAFYRAAGYGAHGSGLVVDPGGEPLRFLMTALERVPVLITAEVALPPSDSWEAYPMLAPWLPVAMWIGGALIALLFTLAIWPKLRSSASARFFSLGALLSAVPVSAQFPHDRLLLFIGVGAAPLLAMLIGDVLEPAPVPEPSLSGAAPALRGGAALLGKRMQRGVSYACVGMHLFLAPLLLPFRVRAPLDGERMVGQSDRSLDDSAAASDKTFVLMNPPLDAYAGYVPVTRAAQGRHRPHALRWLATAGSEVTVTRIDAQTFRVRPRTGFLALPSERMQRNPNDRMPVGYKVEFSDLTIEVTALMPDGRPSEILARFDRPLEDPHFSFYEWRGRRFERFELPKVGETRVLPRVDFLSLLPELD